MACLVLCSFGSKKKTSPFAIHLAGKRSKRCWEKTEGALLDSKLFPPVNHPQFFLQPFLILFTASSVAKWPFLRSIRTQEQGRQENQLYRIHRRWEGGRETEKKNLLPVPTPGNRSRKRGKRWWISIQYLLHVVCSICCGLYLNRLRYQNITVLVGFGGLNIPCRACPLPPGWRLELQDDWIRNVRYYDDIPMEHTVELLQGQGNMGKVRIWGKNNLKQVSKNKQPSMGETTWDTQGEWEQHNAM